MLHEAAALVMAALAVLSAAVLTAAYCAYRANKHLRNSLSGSHTSYTPKLLERIIEDHVYLFTFRDAAQARLIPLFGFATLLVLFFFQRYIGTILIILYAFAGFFTVTFLLSPLFSFGVQCIPAGWSRQFRDSTEFLMLSPLTTGIILTWLYTGHFLQNDIIAASLCLTATCVARLPNLKTLLVVMAAFLVYDMFCIFLSDTVFGTHVMSDLTNLEPSNPAYILAKLLHLPMAPVEQLALPVVIMLPGPGENAKVVGLGDIVFPAILLRFLLEVDLCDSEDEIPPIGGYFVRGTIFYAFGMSMSLCFTFEFGTHPAMLCVVPTLLIPVVVTGWRRGQMLELWEGPPCDLYDHYILDGTESEYSEGSSVE